MRVDEAKIREAKERLGDRNAEIIQELFQMEKYDPVRKIGCCPNPAHDDYTPSCSYNPKTFAFHCFGCGWGADVLEAWMQVEHCTFLEACEKLFREAGMSYDFTERGVLTQGKSYRYPKPSYAPNKDIVYDYWAKRKISKETIDYLDIQQDTRGNTLFQYYDLNDVLVSVKVRLSRAFDPKRDHSKIWHLPDADKTEVLYNINRINPEQPLIITSGEGDCATAIECGFYNAVSINGGDSNTQWVGECWDWLQQFNEIILVHDNDPSGEKFAREISTRLGEYRVKVVDIPTVHTKENGQRVRIKDLNELLFYEGKEAVQEAIVNAKESEIPSIIDYTEVPRFSMSDVEGFRTGLRDLDAALDKFYMGSTTVLTGAPGSGKSSLLSTLICRSVEQGFPCFVYSGELSNPSLKSWVDFVHAGQRGLNKYRSPDGLSEYYKIRPDVYDKINQTYHGKIFFYKDGFEQKVSKIMATAETVVRRYSVKTLIFDNMTSMDMENNDDNKWSKQDEFIREIIAFATRWNVCCLIVLHPKKMTEMRRMNMYDLSGTSSSANLTHRILSLYRLQPRDKEPSTDRYGHVIPGCPFDVTIDVLKDRFGSAGGRTIGLFYDVASRRFFDSPETLDHQYEWDTTDYRGTPLPYGAPQLDLPEEIFGAPLT